MIPVAALWHCCGRHPLYIPSGASLYSVPRCIGPRFPWDSVVHASMRFQGLLHRALDWQAGSTLRIMMARLRHQLDWIHRYLGDTPLVVSIRYFETGLTEKGMCTLMWYLVAFHPGQNVTVCWTEYIGDSELHSTFIFLCFLTSDVKWPAALYLHNYSSPYRMECTLTPRPK